MTFSAVVGVALTLALVLALVAITMRLLRRVTNGTAATRGTIPLTVLQRVALGPRQGIAIVQIGDQVVAVSVGDGGVRTIAELEALPEPATTVAPERAGFDFRSALRAGLKNAGLPLSVLLLATALAPTTTEAQATRGADSASRPASALAASVAKPSAAQVAKTPATQGTKPPATKAERPRRRPLPLSRPTR